jgi:glycosyltransferase involved in cell wall biosynthesis
MKIAIFVPTWPAGTNANGIVTYASYLIPALRHLGHQVFVLTLDGRSAEQDTYTVDLNSVITPRTLIDPLLRKFYPDKTHHNQIAKRISAALVSLQKTTQIDVLEIEESFGWSDLVARTQSVPVVVRLHGPWIVNGQTSTEKRERFEDRVRQEGRALNSASYITAPSQFVLDAVRSHYRIQLDNSRVIYNPIPEQERAWELAGCDQLRVLYVGRFDRAKGADILLKAFEALIELYPSLRLTFVGPDRGIESDDGAIRFEEYAERHLSPDCRRKIDFKGQLSHAAVMELRSNHFFTIVASRFEILPYSVIEAMAMGCPIVASDVGGIAELLSHERNGLLFENGSWKALVEQCLSLLKEPQKAARLGAQARIDCQDMLTPEQVAKETISAYETAIRLTKKRQGVASS